MRRLPILILRTPIFADFRQISGLLVLMGLLACCTSCQKPPLFELIPASRSGITFQNDLSLVDSLNILNYMYFFNGGGVAVGDVNQDGLEDLFFAGNQVSSRLYLNRGEMQFEDATVAAGVETSGWVSGVSIVDLNADGWPDIYACRTAHQQPELRKNLLFINQQDGTFREMAQAYGLADTAWSTHAAFFDYDRDGDLDVYLLNHMHQFSGANDPLPRKTDGSSLNTDRLMRNDGELDSGGSGHPHFTDVSQQAGITFEGFGLGVAVADLNGDDWPDLYVSNDFLSNDLLYLNNQDGTFSNRIADMLAHQSHNGMGNDIADINGDGLPDIFVADMLPETSPRRKRMIMNTGYDLFQLSMQMGYEPQYTRNTLQLNRGNGHFSEIAQLAGIHSTDWSWSPLFADFDNDGDRDLPITNGHFKDLTNLDFIVYRRKRSMFTTQAQRDSLYLSLLDQVSGIYRVNYLYENTGDLRFADRAAEWGFDRPSYSTGAALSDLDLDGDLDLVISNLDEPPFLYENHARQPEGAHSLSLLLEGPPHNPTGIGAKIWLYVGGRLQYQEVELSRGFQSVSSPIVHMGLGQSLQVDSLRIRWPDGREQRLQALAADQRLHLVYADAQPVKPQVAAEVVPLFTDLSDRLGLRLQMDDPPHADFKREPLLPHSFSQNGPAMAVGDANGDGREDLYIGGAAGYRGRLLFQSADGTFIAAAWEGDPAFEDLGLAFFDADGDQDLDLYVVSGGSEYWAGSQMYQDRLYKNDGKGHFERDSLALPVMRSSGSCVVPGDFDGDGDADLFVGGRVIPGRYAATPRSYLLRNEGGNFTDVTQAVAPGLAEIGMVSTALWTDPDGDGWPDLLLAGEWMPLTFFHNQKGKLAAMPIPAFQGTEGWWNSLVAADFDLDGDLDYVAGNLGLNADLQASHNEPVSVHAGFLDDNGSWDAILSSYRPDDVGQRQAFPIHSRDQLLDQLPVLEKTFPDYRQYARAGTDEVMAACRSDSQIIRNAYIFNSCYIENQKNFGFVLQPLPISAQFSPVFGLEVFEANTDRYPDLLCVGNFWSPNVRLGRYDASFGEVLTGDGQGHFEAMPSPASGLLATGDVRDLCRIMVAGRPVWLISRNNGTLLAYGKTADWEGTE